MLIRVNVKLHAFATGPRPRAGSDLNPPYKKSTAPIAPVGAATGSGPQSRHHRGAAGEERALEPMSARQYASDEDRAG
jgi:hypothetical protein